ncbi:MAG: biotin--[acetyl-CoA-carboxylase] ligase, partial [Cyanobacteria bacterium J06582_2]
MKFDLEQYQEFWRGIDQKRAIALPTNLAIPIPLLVFESLPSTNTQLWNSIDEGIECPTGAIALQQTAGKGQWGNTWVSR